MVRTIARPSEVKKKHSGVILFARDAGVALAVVVAVLLAMFAYSGLWPPLVVVESNSMMHGTNNMSHIGAIDTGDLVIVKKVTKATEIKTYMDGYRTGYKTYGDFGDVIIYKKGGSDISTPIIHRALIYLEINEDGTSYTAPSLQNVPKGKWKTVDAGDTWDHLTSTLTIFGLSYGGSLAQIDIPIFLRSPNPQSGFVTKGDHNPTADPMDFGAGIGYRPIDITWVVGVARGEIPWFGLLKLWSTHTINSPAPANSVRDLWIALILIVVSPLAIDLSLSMIERRKRSHADSNDKGSVSGGEKTEAEDASGRAVEPPQT